MPLSARVIRACVAVATCTDSRAGLLGTRQASASAWGVRPPTAGCTAITGRQPCLPESGLIHNSAKRDLLAAEEHLERWVGRNREYGEALGDEFERVGVMHSLRSTLRIASWAYGRAAAGGGQAGQSKSQLVPMSAESIKLLASL